MPPPLQDVNFIVIFLVFTSLLRIGMLFSDGESEGGEDDTSDSDFEPEKEGGNVSNICNISNNNI